METHPRRIGRPSRIHETIREGRCPACRDWIPVSSLRIHFEAAHPLAEPPTAGELREIPLAVRIAEYVAAGCPVDAAAAACDIGRATVFAWIAIGEEWQDVELEDVPVDRRPFRDFSDSIKKAKLAAEPRHLRTIERASATDWKAAAWILERTRPERYSRIEKLRIGGEGAAPIRVVHETTDPDFIADVLRIYREAGIIPDADPPPGA